MLRRGIFLALALLTLSVSLYAQKGKRKKQEEKWLEDAEYYFSEKNYLRALPSYKMLVEAHPDDPYFRYQLGICYLYKVDEKENAILHLELAKKLDPMLPRINFQLGRAYHLNYRFNDAIRMFNKSLEGNPDAEELVEVLHYLKYCESALEIIKDTVDVQIRNAGPNVNSGAFEYGPVITIDESTLIFTYRGERSSGGLLDPKFNPDTTGDYYEDIMMARRADDDWLPAEPLSNNINTKGHDAVIALSNDGQILFIFKSTTKDGGDIFSSTLDGEIWSTPIRLGPNVNTKYWEGSCSLSSDGQILYFASDRPGGFGGRDIYLSRKQSDGSWGPAENLGPTINSPYHDDAPYIHPDGINFFFSSEGHNSMGGYDLFYSTLKAGTWKGAVNLGFPVNTPSNERYYVLTADGGTAYYSSDMKGGHGQQDIYTISPGFLGEPPVIALVVGFVTKNGNPVDAKINVTDSANGNSYGNYQSNASTGKYLIALRPGNTYKVAIEVEGAENYFEYVNVKSLDTYVEVNKDYNFVIPQGGDTAAYAIPVMTDSSDVLQQKIDAQLRLIREEQNVQVYEQRIYRQVLKKHGEDYDSTIHFAVDLGTYQNPADFDSTKLVGLGIIKREITPQGYYRYSVGPFKTMLDADLYRSRIAARDSTIGSNSEVVVYKNGERQTIPSFYRAEYRRKNYVPREETRVVMSKKGTLATAEGTDISYDNVIEDKGTFQAQGLEYKLEIASVTDTNDFRLSYLSKYGKIEKKTYPDGVTRYYFGPWKTLKEADDFRKDLLAKDSVAAQSLIMVFYFGQRKPVQEFFAASPCNHNPVDLAFFKNKTLNNPAVYKKFLSLTGNYCASGLIYRVQIGAYRHPENFKYPQLAEFGAADIKMYADSITRFTLKEFTTVREAEAFRQECIKRGIKDAWITALYKGERKTLEQLILEDFYGKLIQ